MKPVHRWRSWDDAPHVLKGPQVRELFQVDQRTLNDLVAAGLLKRGKVGRRYRYAKIEVMRFAHCQDCDPWPESNPFHGKNLGTSKRISCI